MNERNIYLMFSQNYRQNRLTVNPPTLEAYLEQVRPESVIPQAFVYPKKSIYGRSFWLEIQEEWIQTLTIQRASHSEAEQLDTLDLEIIDIKSKTSCQGLPKDCCSLSLRGGHRLTFNREHSRIIAKKLSTHMLLTRSRQTTDVVLMFNRTRGIEVRFRPSSSGLQFNNVELASRLMELLDLDPAQEYFQLGIELLTETKDYLLFMLKKK